jgi:nicotinamide mononucleotide transporter
MTEFTARLVEGVRATGSAEWVAVVAGVIYIVLILKRNRAGWIAGGISSTILTVLAVRAQLPMQAALQAFYVAAAVYGWWSWSPQSQPQRISTWHLKGHLVALSCCLLASLALSWLLAREGYSAFPFLDSLVACAGLFTTWLVARVYLENWLYWVVIDSISIYMFLSQGLVVTALLFVIYLGISITGLCSWYRTWRQALQPQ